MPSNRHVLLSLALSLAVFGVSMPSVAQDSASGMVPAESCRFPADLAGRLLSGGLDFGDLPLRAEFLIDEETLLDEGRLRALVEGRMEAGPLRQAPTAGLCIFLLLDVDGEALLVHQNRIDIDDFSSVESIRYVLRADLPEGTRRMTLVVHDAESGLWGAAPMQEPTGAISGPGFSAVRVAEYEGTYYELNHRAGGPPPRTEQVSAADVGSAPSGPPGVGAEPPTADVSTDRSASRTQAEGAADHSHRSATGSAGERRYDGVYPDLEPGGRRGALRTRRRGDPDRPAQTVPRTNSVCLTAACSDAPSGGPRLPWAADGRGRCVDQRNRPAVPSPIHRLPRRSVERFCDRRGESLRAPRAPVWHESSSGAARTW